MIVRTEVIDQHANVVFQGETSINALMLTVVAESREALTRSKGADFAQGAVTYFGNTLVAAFKANKPAKELEMAAADVAMAYWLHESIYCDLKAEQFVKCDLLFTVAPGGAVGCTHRPAGS